MFRFNFLSTLVVFQRCTNFRFWCRWSWRCWFLNGNRLTFIVNVFVSGNFFTTLRNFFKGYNFFTTKFRRIKSKLDINSSLSSSWRKLSCRCNSRAKFFTCFFVHKTSRNSVFFTNFQASILNSINKCYLFSFNFFDTLIVFQSSSNLRRWCWWRRRCWFLNSNRLTFIVNIFMRSYNISTFRNFFKGYDFLTAKFRSIKRKLNINCSISGSRCKLSCRCNNRTKFFTSFFVHQTT